MRPQLDVLAGLVIGGGLSAALLFGVLSRGGARQELAQLGPDPLVAPAHAWRYIVLHHSATDEGNAAAFERHHLARGLGGLAYHFVIGNGKGTGDGEIEVGPNWATQQPCNHSGNAEFNAAGIAVCLIGNFEEDARGPTARQTLALEGLVRYLMARFGIDADHVIGHSNVRNTQCPGRYFPLEELRGNLRGDYPEQGAAQTAVSIRGELQ